MSYSQFLNTQNLGFSKSLYFITKQHPFRGMYISVQSGSAYYFTLSYCFKYILFRTNTISPICVIYPIDFGYKFDPKKPSFSLKTTYLSRYLNSVPSKNISDHHKSSTFYHDSDTSKISSFPACNTPFPTAGSLTPLLSRFHIFNLKNPHRQRFP